MPSILARAQRGQLTVLPVFISPSDVSALDIPFTDLQGQEHRNRLSRFQGFGTPQKPLSDMSWSDRERIYQRLSHRIRELAQMHAPAGVQQAGARASVGISQPITLSAAPGSVYEYPLTIHLAANGNQPMVHYVMPSGIVIDVARDWRQVQAELAACLGHLIDTERAVPLAPEAREHYGAVLFDVLFGPEAERGHILRHLFNQPEPSPQPNPTWAPVRLRICTEDALLLSMPWRLTSWNNNRLVDRGWEFVTTQTLQAVGTYTITASCNVLIVVPHMDAPDAMHAQAIHDVLTQVWPTGRTPGYVQVARNRSELVNGLRGMRPHLVYIYAPGAIQRGHPSLRLEGSGAAGVVRLRELADLLRDGHPAMVYLHVTGLGDANPNPAQVLGPVVPLLIWHRLPSRHASATSHAVAWLRHWLQTQADPVSALHHVTNPSDTDDAVMLSVHTQYRAWQTHAYPPSAAFRERLPHLQLDRDEQKALVAKHLGELVSSNNRRVMALVAYAEPGNLIQSLHEQLEHYVSLEMTHRADINWRRLQFPVVRDNLLADLEAELKLQLDTGDAERLPFLLRRHAPRVVGTGRRSILWLNWGVFGRGEEHQPPLRPTELGAWLRFTSETLGSQCPADLRIVSYVAIKMEGAQHARLRKMLSDERWQPWGRRPEFRLDGLPPLGTVTADHLFNFLLDGHSSCDAAIHEEITQRLMHKTSGHFEEITRLMQEAEDGSWYDLLTQLRREQGDEPPIEDNDTF